MSWNSIAMFVQDVTSNTLLIQITFVSRPFLYVATQTKHVKLNAHIHHFFFMMEIATLEINSVFLMILPKINVQNVLKDIP